MSKVAVNLVFFTEIKRFYKGSLFHMVTDVASFTFAIFLAVPATPGLFS